MAGRGRLNIFFCPNGGPAQGTGTGIGVLNCAQWTEALRDPNNLRAFAENSANAAGLSGGSVWVLNNKSKMPYSDQFNLGVRKRFGDIQTSLTFSHIRSHNIQMFVRANFMENGWYTRFVTRDGAGNVIGCTDGGDAWIWDNVSGSLTNANGSPVATSVCAAQNGSAVNFRIVKLFIIIQKSEYHISIAFKNFLCLAAKVTRT